jgi:hypothetical protein
MTIIQKSNAFLHTVQPHITKKVQTLFLFGYLSLSIQRVVSLNRNARTTVANTKTAESKMYRLSRNERLLALFPRLMVELGLVQENDLVNVDFSDFNGRNVLMFAKQTEEGRAIPLYFEYIEYPVDEGEQNAFIIEATKRFLGLIGIPVRLVWDRGFAIPSLVDSLANLPIIFYIRIKQGKRMELMDGRVMQARLLRRNDVAVRAYGRNLRLVISDKPDADGEPWYVITNDMRRSRRTIVAIYYHRFEIEEFFKDGKRVFLLEHLRVRKDSTFRIVLWFVMLGMWFIWFLHKFNWVKGRKRSNHRRRTSLSVITYWLEWMEYQMRAAILQQIRFAGG